MHSRPSSSCSRAGCFQVEAKRLQPESSITLYRLEEKTDSTEKTARIKSGGFFITDKRFQPPIE
jgi:hypothetical protein